MCWSRAAISAVFALKYWSWNEQHANAEFQSSVTHSNDHVSINDKDFWTVSLILFQTENSPAWSDVSSFVKAIASSGYIKGPVKTSFPKGLSVETCASRLWLPLLWSLQHMLQYPTQIWKPADEQIYCTTVGRRVFRCCYSFYPAGFVCLFVFSQFLVVFNFMWHYYNEQCDLCPTLLC